MALHGRRVPQLTLRAALGFYLGDDLPATNHFATHYTSLDSLLLQPSWPDSAQPELPAHQGCGADGIRGSAPRQRAWAGSDAASGKTMFDLLSRHGVLWRIYASWLSGARSSPSTGSEQTSPPATWPQ